MSSQPTAPQLRVRVFVDFWNFVLSAKTEDDQFKIDWEKLGFVLAQEAAKKVDPSAPFAYEGTHVYGSYDPSKASDTKLKHWFLTKLDKFTGVHVTLLERQRKRNHFKCPHCQSEVAACPQCSGDLRGTEEKGVDTRIATEMISLAWANGYNVAVLASADRDFVPVAEFLQTKGIKVIHATFPPKGSHLTTKCWGHIHVAKAMPLFKR